MRTKLRPRGERLFEIAERVLKNTDRSFEEWLVDRGKERARAWQARYWPKAAVPLPDTKYLWPRGFKHKGHRAMLVTGYSEEGSVWSDLRTFYAGESITVQGVTTTPPEWLPVVRVLDRRGVLLTAAVVLFRAFPAFALLVGLKWMFHNSFRSQIRRPLVLCVVAPGPQTRTLTPQDAEEAADRELTVVFDATGIICLSSFEDAQTELTRRAIKDTCAWALAAAGRATARDEPGGRPEGSA